MEREFSYQREVGIFKYKMVRLDVRLRRRVKHELESAKNEFKWRLYGFESPTALYALNESRSRLTNIF